MVCVCGGNDTTHNKIRPSTHTTNCIQKKIKKKKYEKKYEKKKKKRNEFY